MTPPEERRNSAARRSRGMLDQAEVVAGRVVEVGRHRRDHLDRLQFLVGEQYLQGGQARRWRAGRPDAVNRGTPSCGDATSREVARLPPFLAEEKLRRSVPTSGEGLSRNLISLHVGWSTHWSTGWSPRHAVGCITLHLRFPPDAGTFSFLHLDAIAWSRLLIPRSLVRFQPGPSTKSLRRC